MNIMICGSGYVGCAIGKQLKSLGHNIIYYDTVEKPGVTTNINYAVNSSEICFIAVPTPSKKSGEIDLSYIKSAARNIAKVLRRKKEYFIVIKSTVIPGTCENIVKPILEKYSNKQVGKELKLAMVPEFLTEISHKWDKTKEFERTPETEERIVIGTLDKRSGDILESIYKPFNKPIYRVDTKTAEMIKYVSNCCLASRVSYWVEIFFLCKKLGIDGRLVADIVAKDKRIGKYGSVITDPPGFYGKCLPKDLKAFINFAKKVANLKLLKAVDEINDYMKKKYGARE